MEDRVVTRGLIRLSMDKKETAMPRTMKRFCLARHEGAVSVTFFDFSLRKAGVKELWTLKWHRDYDTSGPWTRIGGVEPSDWPPWRSRYPEY